MQIATCTLNRFTDKIFGKNSCLKETSQQERKRTLKNCFYIVVVL